MNQYDPYTQILHETLGTLRLEQPHSHRELCVLPLISTSECAAKYVLLDSAVSRGTLTITEVDEAGSVPYLTAVNKGPWPVLIFDGEELQGAKQNRICNATILVGVGKSMLPVSCVEQGRWSRTSHAFSAGVYAAHPSLRRKKESLVRRHAAMAATTASGERRDHTHDRVSERRRATAGVESQAERAVRYLGAQTEVWEEVGMSLDRLGIRSDSLALADAHKIRHEDIDEYVRALGLDGDRALDSMLGVVVFVGGRLVCLDLLQPAKRFRQLYPKLLRGYALEAMFSADPADDGDVYFERETLDSTVRPPAGRRPDLDPEAFTLRLLDELKNATLQTQSGVDLGQDLRLDGRTVSGAGLAWNRDVIQLSLFPKTAA